MNVTNDRPRFQDETYAGLTTDLLGNDECLPVWGKSALGNNGDRMDRSVCQGLKHRLFAIVEARPRQFAWPPRCLPCGIATKGPLPAPRPALANENARSGNKE
jgi:hypothetical protein